MDIDGAEIDRPLVGEHLHPVDQRDDAVDLLADEMGQAAPGLVQPRLQELGSTAHAGKRVLHLMGQSGGQRPHGAGGAAAGQRLVQPAGEGALLQSQRQPALAIGERRHIDGDEAVSERRRFDRHLAVGDAGPLGAGLVERV